MTAGVGTAAAIASLVADAGQWTTRLSREVKSVVRTSSTGVSGFSRTVGTWCSGGGIGWDYVESEVLG